MYFLNKTQKKYQIKKNTDTLEYIRIENLKLSTDTLCMCVCDRDKRLISSTVQCFCELKNMFFKKNEKEYHRRASTKYLPHWYSEKYKHYTEIALYIIKLEKNV